jgi:hypothetical protein
MRMFILLPVAHAYPPPSLSTSESTCGACSAIRKSRATAILAHPTPSQKACLRVEGAAVEGHAHRNPLRP